MLRTASVRVLADRNADEALALLGADPVANVYLSGLIETSGLDPWRLGAEVWGYPGSGPLEALCHAGASLVPVGTDTAAMHAFAERARRLGRRCSSIVGAAAAVDPLWAQLEPFWGPPRDRRTQPLLATSAPAQVPADPYVRRVRPAELEIVLPACIAMYTEEVGVSPTAADGGAFYRARVAELIRTGRSFARIENGRVVFKAEIGALSRAACQVQGVWVDPALRGRGLSVAGMAAVVDTALVSLAPAVSLYVNDYNLTARRAYARVGFREVGRFTSVLF